MLCQCQWCSLVLGWGHRKRDNSKQCWIDVKWGNCCETGLLPCSLGNQHPIALHSWILPSCFTLEIFNEWMGHHWVEWCVYILLSSSLIFCNEGPRCKVQEFCCTSPTKTQVIMPSSKNTSNNAFDAPVLPLGISFMDGTTVLNAGPSLNQFLDEEKGPFAMLGMKWRRTPNLSRTPHQTNYLCLLR